MVDARRAQVHGAILSSRGEGTAHHDRRRLRDEAEPRVHGSHRSVNLVVVGADALEAGLESAAGLLALQRGRDPPAPPGPLHAGELVLGRPGLAGEREQPRVADNLVAGEGNNAEVGEGARGLEQVRPPGLERVRAEDGLGGDIRDGLERRADPLGAGLGGTTRIIVYWAPAVLERFPRPLATAAPSTRATSSRLSGSEVVPCSTSAGVRTKPETRSMIAATAA